MECNQGFITALRSTGSIRSNCTLRLSGGNVEETSSAQMCSFTHLMGFDVMELKDIIKLRQEADSRSITRWPGFCAEFFPCLGEQDQAERLIPTT